VQKEGTDYQHSNGLHGCEVPSEDNNAYGSPLPVSLRVIPPVMLCTLTLYTIIVFSAIRRQIILLFLDGTVIVLAGGMSYCLFDLGLGEQPFCYLEISKLLVFQLHHNTYISTNSVYCIT